MEIWLIAVIVAGGIIFLALLALIIYKCCCQRRRRGNKNGKEQNGHVWQAHDKDVELADEEEPRDKLKEDGLCKDTEAASTLERRVKPAQDQDPEPQRRDGLCEETDKRFTYPRRGRPESELLLPIDKKNLSTSENGLKSAVPVGVSVITCFEGKDLKENNRRKSDVQVHRAEHEISKEKGKEKDSSSDSSSDSDDDETRRNGAQHLIKSSDKKSGKDKRVRSFVQRKRSKSLHNSLEEMPEYSKPIKRSISNPSIIAREKMLQKDERFRSLETWRSTIPIPDPDYPNENSVQHNEEDEEDNALPSYATSDSGVECLDALSGHDDESINHCDSVPESPGIPSQLKDDTSFSSLKGTTRYQESKHITNTTYYGINGFKDNAVVMTTKDHTALIDANAEKNSPSPFAANQQGIFFQSTPTENKPRDITLPYSDPKLALRSTSPASNTVSSSTQKPAERIQTKDAQMDFRNVKLRHTSTNYEQNHTFAILGSNHGYTSVTPSFEQKKQHPTSLEHQRSKNQDPASPAHLQSGQSIIINKADRPDDQKAKKQANEAEKKVIQINRPETENQTDFNRPKDHYILGGSKKQANEVEKKVIQINRPETENRTDFNRPKDHYILGGSKNQANETEKKAIQINRPETENPNQTDFYRVHLRQTPQSLKQHIGFREELDPRALTETQTPEDHSTSKTDKENETVSGVLDGIKKFQSQGAQAPKPVYGFGSHYISKKDHHEKPVNIISKEPVANTKPVRIVAPEPPTMDRDHHKTITISSSYTTREVKADQKENVPTIVNKNEKRRPVSVINESMVSEDRSHIRYSTGNVNQSHVSLGFKDSPQNKLMVIRGSEEEEKTNATSSKQDSLDKPVAVVPPQSPKAKRETEEERAAFEEERKKNWKREQIEQKLTSVHLRSQKQNEQFMQASGLAYRQCMPELFSKIKQIGEEKDEAPVE